MARGLDVNEIIDIQTQIQDGGTIRTEFGTGLLLTEDDSIPAGGSRKCQRFTSLAGVAEVFDSAQVEHDAGVWFGADPAPKALYIGRWARENVNTTLVTGRVTTSQTDIQSISNGSYRLNGQDDTGLSFAGSNGSDFSEISNTLATAISTITGTGSATITFDATTQKFTIDFGSTADLGVFATSTTSVGTDLTDTFKLTAAGGAVYNQGSDAESVTDAVTRCVALATGGDPTALLLGGDVPATYTSAGGGSVTVVTEMRTIAQAGDYMFAMLDTSTGALTAGESTSPIALAFAAAQSHVIPVYSRGNALTGENYAPRPDIALMAKLSSQNFNLPQSIITPVPKSLSGVGTTTLTTGELSELERKRASVYTPIGGLPSLMGGFSASPGVWADAQWWLLWLKSETERTVFQAMRASNRLSNAELVDALNSVMGKAVRSGGAKPGGKVNNATKHQIQATTGNYDFDGILRTGYVLWVDPPLSGTDADRAARISRFKVWIAPSEAIHSVTGAIVLSG